LQLQSAALVVRHLIGMLTTIELNDQPGIRTNKVDDVTANLVLPTELPSPQVSCSQMTPERLLGVGLLLTKIARPVYV